VLKVSKLAQNQLCGFHNNSSDLNRLNSGFLGRLQQHIIDKALNECQNDRGPVSLPNDSIQTRDVPFATAKYFIILIGTLIV